MPVIPAENWVEMSLVGAMYETLMLIELDAFETTPTTNRLADIAGFDHLSRDELIEELDFVDDDNDILLNFLSDQQWEWVSDDVDTVLTELPQPIIDLIDDGRTEFLDPTPWLNAIDDIARRRGAEPGPGRTPDHNTAVEVLNELDRTDEIDLDAWTEPKVMEQLAAQSLPGSTVPAAQVPANTMTPSTVLPATTAPATTATTSPAQDEPGEPDERVESDEPDEPDERGLPAADDPATGSPAETGSASGDSGLPVVPIAGGAVAALALAAAFVAKSKAGGRASSNRAAETADVGSMLEVSRRMTSALDAGEIRSIAVQESLRLTGAESAAYVTKVDGAAEVVHSSAPHVFASGHVRSGIVGRALDAGQKVCEVVDSDPLVPNGTSAVAAIAVIANGGVEGAIVVARSPERPFAIADLHTLETLAPMVGAALQAAEAHRSAVTAADVDGLTQLRNRRRLDADMNLVNGSGVCFAMIDVDHFKRFNDTFGHRAGDRALQVVAKAVETNVRAEDVVYRYGGEEFSVLLYECDLDDASEVLDRVRQAVSETPIPLADGSVQYVTVSVGVASYPGDPEGIEALATAADDALYEAKESGRDRVIVART